MNLPTPAVPDRSLRRPQPAGRLLMRLGEVYNAVVNQGLLYAYQHLLLEGLDSEAATLFLSLAGEKTEQARALGRLIKFFGGDPALALRLRTPRVDLSDDASCRALPLVRRLLRENMQAEAGLLTMLESASALTEPDSQAREMLRDLIGETQMQYRRLESLVDRME